MSRPAGRVLFVAAHPDDADFLAGGTVAKLVKEGRETAYVVVSNGNKGASDPGVRPEQLIPLREAEQRHAARTLGVAGVTFLGYEDGELEDTRDLRRDVTREIRRWRPDLVITLSPYRTYNNFPGWHRDHRTTARVVLDCVYPLARDHLAFPELLPDYEPHKVREVYMIQWEQPRLVIDITDTLDAKIEAIRCHTSQVGDLKAFEERMRKRAAALGKEKGYAYAEGFDHVTVPG
ncbi:MAG TPA: PIG-L deacetylase family protein [Candidatus Acidoferrum sp.]|nr:PIG-L deacetylase family protein [Candidatus Acidoferrum sp.]